MEGSSYIASSASAFKMSDHGRVPGDSWRRVRVKGKKRLADSDRGGRTHVPSRGSVTTSLASGRGVEPNDSLIEERRRCVKSLKSTVRERTGRRIDDCRVRFDEGKPVVPCIAQGAGRLAVGGERKDGGADVVPSSESGDGLATILLVILGQPAPNASYNSELTRAPSIVAVSSTLSNSSSSSSISSSF